MAMRPEQAKTYPLPRIRSDFASFPDTSLGFRGLAALPSRLRTPAKPAANPLLPTYPLGWVLVAGADEPRVSRFSLRGPSARRRPEGHPRLDPAPKAGPESSSGAAQGARCS